MDSAIRSVHGEACKDNRKSSENQADDVPLSHYAMTLTQIPANKKTGPVTWSENIYYRFTAMKGTITVTFKVASALSHRREGNIGL